MVIGGLQKLSLLDWPDKMCCTVFTAGCDFRCPFCHNAGLVLGTAAPGGHTPETVLAFLEKRRGLLDGVCVSGGEPLLQPGLEDFMAAARALGFAVKLDTNGSHPERLRALVAANLVDYVAMDIKSAPENYPAAVGRPGFEVAPVLESAAFLMEGSVDCEFRTTVVRGLHTEADFTAIGRWLPGARKYYLQSFVDSGDILSPGLAAFSADEMAGFLSLLREKVPNAALRGA